MTLMMNTFGVDLNDKEKEVLEIPPKFCVMRNLTDKGFNQDLELCNTKLRYDGDQKRMRMK